VPNRLEMYPEGYSATVSMGGPAKAGLEDAFRPHFFDGVATVVAKLFNAAGCDYAMFGEKDYQQLKVVTAMARDLAIPTTVVGVATVREADGLAMSSRNAYLSADERQMAHQCCMRPCSSLRKTFAVARTFPARAPVPASGWKRPVSSLTMSKRGPRKPWSQSRSWAKPKSGCLPLPGSARPG
jgi:pantoate--beta-alanine ligase